MTDEQKQERVGYTAEDFENDTAAGASLMSGGSFLAEITGAIKNNEIEIERLEQQASDALMNPLQIPVPEDKNINPLMAIGAGLRAMGGDSSALDALINQKQQVANYQRAVTAQNVQIQNEYAAEQRRDINNLLEGKRRQVANYKLEAAKIVDGEIDEAGDRRWATFQAEIAALGEGVGSAEAVAAKFPQELIQAGHDLDYLVALEERGKLSYQRAKRLAESAPNNVRAPSTPEGAAQDAENMNVMLSRGYHLAPKLNAAGVEIGKEKVPFTPGEIRAYMTTFEAAMQRMPEDQKKIWQPQFDFYKKQYDIAPGPQPDDLSMIDFVKDFEKYIYG